MDSAALGQPDLAAGPLYSLHYRGLPHISTFPLFYLILFESTWYVRAASCALRWTRLNDAKNPLPTKSSGVTVNDECNKIYQTLKLGKTIKYVIFRLSDDKATIVVDKTSDSTNYDDFLADLPKASSRPYCLGCLC